MAELIAVGKGSLRQSRRSIEEGDDLLLGRAPRSGWSVPWDRLISREHARVRVIEDRLEVTALPTARNPILLEGQPTSSFQIEMGQTFRIGETIFSFRDANDPDEGGSVIAEHLLGSEDLSSERFTKPSSCLHALCEMPDIIANSQDDADLAERVVELLLDTIRGSLAAAVMRFETVDGDTASPKLIRWNSRGESVQRFQHSRRLLRRALEHEQSVVHLWMDDDKSNQNFTLNDGLDWAFCTPIPIDANERWCLYVTGKRRFAGMREVHAPQDLIGELRTAELVARFIGAVRQTRALEKQHQEMRRFFSPAVIETLAGDPSAAALEPRSGPVSVLFCDVRGFSRKVESSDNLHAVLHQVSLALSVMTRSILKFEGVIGDFQGDAALGFWGWPNDTGEAPTLACRAALLIHDTFAQASSDPSNPLHGYQVGLGIAHGNAIAGKIGAQEQIKVGVFGPVVNLASRLQDLTKLVELPILIDDATAEAARDALPESDALIRRIARLRPTGIETPVMVHAVISSQSKDRQMEGDSILAYEAALEALQQGDWNGARALAEGLPKGDKPSAFLRSVLDSATGDPPDEWDGVLTLEQAGTVRFKTGTTTRVGKNL